MPNKVQAGETGGEGGHKGAGLASSAARAVLEDEIGGASVPHGPLSDVNGGLWEDNCEGQQQDAATSKGQDGPQGSTLVAAEGTDAGGAGSLGDQAGLQARQQLVDEKLGAGKSQAGSEVQPSGCMQAAPEDCEASQPLAADPGGQGTATQAKSEMSNRSSSPEVPGKASKKGLLRKLLGWAN